MGLLAHVYKARTTSGCSADGISAHFDEVCVVNANGPFHPHDDTPPVLLVAGYVWGAVIAVPAVPVATEEWEPAGGLGNRMMGGCFIETSDSRFDEAIRQVAKDEWDLDFHQVELVRGPIALHDRFER